MSRSHTTRPRLLAAFAGAAALAGLLAACTKSGPEDLTSTAPAARIKFFNFGVGAPNVNFYANDTKMTAVGSTTGAESNLGTASGSAAAGGYYTSITPGAYTFTGKITAATDNGLVVGAVTTTVADGKTYSLYLSGIYDVTAKKSDAFVVEDNYPADIDYSVALVRFVNAISNASPMTLYAKSTDTGTETAVGAAQAYKGAGAFVPLAGGTYDLSTRLAGSAANVITRAGVSFNAGRVYTVGARGDVTVTSSTSANRPQLDNTANR